VRRADNLTTLLKSGSLNLPDPSRPRRPVSGLLYLFSASVWLFKKKALISVRFTTRRKQSLSSALAQPTYAVRHAECPLYITVQVNELFFFYQGLLYLKNATGFNSTRVSVNFYDKN
jgi:hypothetical protein